MKNTTVKLEDIRSEFVVGVCIEKNPCSNTYRCQLDDEVVSAEDFFEYIYVCEVTEEIDGLVESNVCDLILKNEDGDYLGLKYVEEHQNEQS